MNVSTTFLQPVLFFSYLQLNYISSHFGSAFLRRSEQKTQYYQLVTLFVNHKTTNKVNNYETQFAFRL